MTWNDAFNALTDGGMPVHVAAHELYFALRNPNTIRNGACYASCDINAPWDVAVTAKVIRHRRYTEVDYEVSEIPQNKTA